MRNSALMQAVNEINGLCADLHNAGYIGATCQYEGYAIDGSPDKVIFHIPAVGSISMTDRQVKSKMAMAHRIVRNLLSEDMK